MNAEALLKAYGWSGSGSLDSHNGSSSRGLSKPLLISKKVDVLGLGLNKHAAVSDQWWMRAYDSGLKDLGTGKKSTLAEVREKGMFAGGLYGRFVKGESEGGTLQLDSERKRKRGEEEVDSGYESKNGKKQRTGGEKKTKKCVSKRVDAFVDEAKRRGLLEGAVVKSAKGKSVGRLYGEKAVAAVFRDAGFEDSSKPGRDSSKQQKYSTERQLRQLKEAAKVFVISQLSPEEQAELKRGAKSSDSASLQKQLAKDQAKAARAAAKAAAKEVRTVQKQKDLEMKAWEKSVTVEEYLRQRKEKKSSKGKSTAGIAEVEDTPIFAVDTVGDSTLAAQANQVVDTAGNIRYTMVEEIPIPLDPTIWEGIDVKKLPKRVREARRQWMENKRESKKSAKSETKSKDEKKIERQEALVLEILTKSRKAKKNAKTAPIGGLDDVPLVTVATKKDEPFTTEEMALARTVARRALKDEKRKKSNAAKS